MERLMAPSWLGALDLLVCQLFSVVALRFAFFVVLNWWIGGLSRSPTILTTLPLHLPSSPQTGQAAMRTILSTDYIKVPEGGKFWDAGFFFGMQVDGRDLFQ